MEIQAAKPAHKSQTYTAAGWAKRLSLFATVLGAISGASFVGAPAIARFLPEDTVSQIQAISVLVGSVSTAIAAHQSGRAQAGRLNARAAIYTPEGQPGLDQTEAGTVTIPSTPDEALRLADLTPFIEGQESLEVFIDRRLRGLGSTKYS